MGSVLCWLCPKCGVAVPVGGGNCPNCGHSAPSTPPPTSFVKPESKRPPAPWAQAISVPTAIMGIVAFFLPWFQMSCGPLRLQFSGYELATGKWEDKIHPEHSQQFWNEVNKDINQRVVRRGANRRGAGPAIPPSNQAQPPVAKNISDPLLWAEPIACCCLLLLALFGVPKVPTVLVSLAGSAYMAYFAVQASSAATDPQNTGGILEYSWLLGFWMAWVGLVAPAVVALARPNGR